MRVRLLAAFSLMSLAAGCGGVASELDGGAPDAGPVDGGSSDAGFPDAGEPDGGELDAGALDAGGLDAGVADAGVDDAGLADAGGSDAGVLDGGFPALEAVVAQVSINRLLGFAGGYPLRFNGANKVTVVNDTAFVLSPEGDVPASRITQRIYSRVASSPSAPWVEAARLEGPMNCQFATGRESISAPCVIGRLFTWTGALVRDAAGYLHVWEFAAVRLTTMAAPEDTRLVHFRSDAPAGAGPLAFTAFVQPPDVHDAYSAGVVTTSWDDVRQGFHVVWNGGPASFVQPNYDARFAAASGGRVTLDPYRAATGVPDRDSLYNTVTMFYGFLPQAAPFLPAPQVLALPEPAFYDPVNVEVEAAIEQCTGPFSLLRSRKYPFLVARGGELLFFAEVNAEDCRNLFDGGVCCRALPDGGVEPVTRPTQPHQNLEWRRYQVGDGGALVLLGGGFALPNLSPAEVRCNSQYDLFDVAPLSTGDVGLVTTSTSEAFGGCTQTRLRTVSLLTADGRFLKDVATVDVASGFGRSPGAPCLFGPPSDVGLVVPTGADVNGLALARTLPLRQSGSGTATLARAPDGGFNTIPRGRWLYGAFAQCLNARAWPQVSASGPRFLVSAVDADAGQVEDVGVAGSVILSVDLVARDGG